MAEEHRVMLRVFACLAYGIATTTGSTVLPERLAQIQEIQRTPGVLWQAGVNARFGSQPLNGTKSLCGLKKGWEEEMQRVIANGELERFPESTNLMMPESFDSEKNWPECAELIGDIRDQSNCGCCWAFAGAEAASDRMCIATKAKIKIPLSAQDVCFCGSNDGCDGGFVAEPWSYISIFGAVSGGQYKGSGPFGAAMCSDFSLPHCHHHGPQGKDPYPAEGKPGCPSEKSPQCPTQCDAGASSAHSDFMADKYTYSGKAQTASGEAAIQQMIMAGGPVGTGFTVYSDFSNYVSGIYHHVSGSQEGGHAVKIVGWGVEGGVKYWKVANSWNPYWGEKGYFRIRRGNNECGIEAQVVGSSASATWGKLDEVKLITSNSTDQTWACSVCGHVYDAQKDGGGVPFEKLPDTWKCPVCGKPKSAYKPSFRADGSVVWVHDDSSHRRRRRRRRPTSGMKCSVCGHVYDAQKDGGGLPFEQLPDSWKCPKCGKPKSAYKPFALSDGSIVWSHDENSPAATMKCSVCAHVYDADKDGGGLPFEKLPDSWKCPVCGQPKSAYKPTTLSDGSTVWSHDEHDPAATMKCSVCGHVYDAEKDGGGLPFEKLPDSWKCPVCGKPKSAYKPSTLSDGSVVWSHDDDASAASMKCSVCGHVYDAEKDGGGLPFEKLPDSWKCPVCGKPKSAYKPSTLSDGSIVWSHDDEPLDTKEKCSVCGHIYDAQKDGGGLPFEKLPDSWKCPVCGQPKSAYKPTALPDGSMVWSHDAEDIPKALTDIVV